MKWFALIALVFFHGKPYQDQLLAAIASCHQQGLLAPLPSEMLIKILNEDKWMSCQRPVVF